MALNHPIIGQLNKWISDNPCHCIYPKKVSMAGLRTAVAANWMLKKAFINSMLYGGDIKVHWDSDFSKSGQILQG